MFLVNLMKCLMKVMIDLEMIDMRAVNYVYKMLSAKYS